MYEIPVSFVLPPWQFEIDDTHALPRRKILTFERVLQKHRSFLAENILTIFTRIAINIVFLCILLTITNQYKLAK